VRYEAVVIGVSSGGLTALRSLLPALPDTFRMPVMIVQHIGSTSEGYWIEALNAMSALNIKEADEKEAIQKGNVYIAPPDYHLLVEADRTFSLSADRRVNFARPSIDVLFETAALAYKEKLIGIVLTGSNSDGALGLKTIKDLGGFAIVQNPVTAEASQMPVAAIKATTVDLTLPLDKIAEALTELEKL
jgi:two-component system, chemotaxis family, protein-glutamate methylesterase/glutaminase